MLIAVAGAQGAGKTTFIRECYGLDDTWLGSNAGRGERVPVMVVEDVEDPRVRGWVVVLDGADQKVQPLTPAEFGDALRGLGKHQLILGLTVPPAVFGTTGRGFLLLPGYESITTATREWQALMRQALVTAPDAIVVVDQGLLASNSQQGLIDDLRESLGKDPQPVVVVSKTERLAPDDPERAELRERAVSLFGLRTADHVVLTGQEDAVYRKQWLSDLQDALARALPSARQMRLLQLTHLRTIVRQDVRDVLTRVRSAVQVHPVAEDSVAYRMALDSFDDAARQVSAEYGRFTLTELDRHRDQSYLLADEVLARRAEADEWGLDELTHFIKGQIYLHRRKLEREFADCWQRAGQPGSGFAAGHSRAAEGAIAAAKPLVIDLGWDPERLRAALGDLRALGGHGGSDHRFSGDLNRNLAMLPLMALEAVRTTADAPQLLDRESGTPAEHDAADVLQKIGEERLAMLAGFGAVLGADLAPEGALGTAPQIAQALTKSLFGAAKLSGAGAAAMGTLGALVGAAALGLAVVNYGNKYTVWKAGMGRQILDALHEKHQRTIEEEFRRLLAQVRRQVEFSLRRHFKVDEDAAYIIEVDRALAQVKAARQRVIDEFDQQV